jgi:hypothetical protein
MLVRDFVASSMRPVTGAIRRAAPATFSPKLIPARFSAFMMPAVSLIEGVVLSGVG